MNTIADLVEELSKLPQDMEILAATDSEGNSFKRLEDIGTYFVEKPDPGTDEINEVFTEEDLDDEPQEVLDYAFRKVAVIWPV